LSDVERAAESLPGVAGAYALRFRVDAPISIPVQRLGNPVLIPGTYVYAGSAFGPGGIRARVLRHLRTGKRPHWHVDRLSAVAECIGVEGFPGRNECELVADFLFSGAEIPVAGFGSSDCRTCRAHLVRLAAPR
jgi:Uri superfamily endonuclease